MSDTQAEMLASVGRCDFAPKLVPKALARDSQSPTPHYLELKFSDRSGYYSPQGFSVPFLFSAFLPIRRLMSIERDETRVPEYI